MDKEAVISIGDLVQLRKNVVIKSHFPAITRELLGLGIIIEKLSELLVLPSDEVKYVYNSDVYSPYHKPEIALTNPANPIKTKICKVFWFNVQKIRWHYEDELQVISSALFVQ